MAPKKEDLDPKVRKQAKVISYDWGLNPHKLQLATTHVEATTSGLSAEARHDAIKARYIELKGRLPGEKRHKDGKNEKGKPTPTNGQGIAYDAGESGVDKDGEDDEDEEDMDELVEEAL